MENQVEQLGLGELDQVVEVLAESFRDYPVMRFVLESDDRVYDDQLRLLMRFFSMARFCRDEFVLGVRAGERLQAVALVSRSGPTTVSSERLDELARLRTELWHVLGASAQARYEDFGRACAPFDPGVPHLHLNMIGVRDAARGQGLGRLILDHLHRMSALDAESEGVSLSTETERNVPLYRYFGYEIIGQADVSSHSSQLSTWAFFRADRPAE